MSLQKHSENQSSIPRPHFNIRHRELSASGVVPGTTSDNFPIIPHQMKTNYTEDLSGGHSNGHLQNDPRRFSDNIVVHAHPSPPPHFQGTSSTSSNGLIPGSGSATFPKEYHQNSDNFASVNMLSESEMNNNTVLLRRGAPDMKISNVNVDVIRTERPQTIGNGKTNVLDVSNVVDKHNTQVKQCPSPPQKHGYLTPAKELCDSSPVGNIHSDWKQSRFSAGDADFGELDFVAFNFDDDDDMDLSLQPPPQPCGNIAHPVQRFHYKPPAPLPKPGKENLDSENNKYIHPLPRKPKHFLMRSQSFELLENHFASHSYVNVELHSVQMRNAIADTPYFRFYYNLGFVRMLDARMSKKIERRSRLSSLLENIDFNFLDRHELWFDRCYKSRDKDLKFLK